MRNRSLHDALRGLAEQAAGQLAADTARGAEVPFDLVAEPGRGSAPLYCYRALTGEFIRGRAGALSRLPAYAPATAALEAFAGLESYLELRGEARVPGSAGERAHAVVRTFLAAVFEELSEFELDPERFGRAYAQLELVLLETRALSEVAAPLRGLAIVSPEVPLGDGLSLVRADALDDAPPGIARLARGAEERAAEAIAVLRAETEPGAPPALTAARRRFRRLLTALRLFDSGAFVLGPAGWERRDRGPWQLVTLATGGRPRGDACLVPPEGEDELRAFCNLVARRAPRGGELAWALDRFEMGCERLAPFEALTDHLLALRALLEPEGPGSGRLAARLAAICALPEQREALAERIAHAISLERAVIAGLAPAHPGVDTLVDELAGHLRALLRDALCGHLDPDLVGVAEGLLGAGTAPAAVAG